MKKFMQLSVLLTSVFCTSFSCKGSSESYASDKQDQSFESAPGFNLSDSQETLTDIANFYFLLFQKSYVRNVNEMETYKLGQVNAERTPYSDGWFPEKNGGTNTNGSLTRWDQAFFSGEPKATNWEKENHGSTIAWYGHCNGYSAAAARHQNPGKSVYRPKGCTPGSAGCVEFQPQHIRALLSEVYMNAQSRFLGGNRCHLAKEQISTNPQDRLDPTVMDSCDDLDPGSFHVALVNYIALQKQVLVGDSARWDEVWNYPIYKYSYFLEENGRRLNRQEAAAETKRSGAADYVFNPHAVSFVKVTNTVSYAKALGTPQPGQPAPTEEMKVTYRYLLELDASDNIIGGEWLGDSRVNHPDFVWMPFEPFDPPGNRKFGNPFVDNKIVVEMWAESVGFDPANPFGDPKNPNVVKNMPTGEILWGKKDKFFAATIDGSSTGAVFLGKRTFLSITRDTKLFGDVVLDLMLNGHPLIQLTGTANSGFEVQFDAQPGINVLDFKWKLNGQPVDGADETLRFYSMR